METNTTHISILGLGWLGLPLAQYLQKKGYGIRGSVHSIEKLSSYNHFPFGVTRISLEKDQIKGDWEAFLHDANVLIICTPPRISQQGKENYLSQIRQVVANTSSQTKVIYTSSTSVYGNGEQPITENEPLKPERESGEAVVEAERVLRQHFNENLTILRFAGLIGPDRHPGKFLAEKRALRNGLAPVNLVHLDDCIGIIHSVIKKQVYGEVFNVCCSEHPQRKTYYEKAATILGLTPPVFKEETGGVYKIIDNSKSIQLLGYQYKYNNPEELFTNQHSGKITIVGAGPGAMGCLTLRAYEAVEHAEVILYDNLVSKEILDINPQAEFIYVGRKFADKSNQQDRQNRINELLHLHYKQGRNVVRLKSGDPYVYGRAAEEARYLTAHHLPFEIVPGLSAALAAANLNNIPVTERGKSNAFMICTAHTADYSYEQLNGIAALLKAGNSLAVYMAMKSLDKLIPKLIEVCEDDTIPITAVANVSRENEQVLTSTLKDIQEDVEKADLAMPVVFLIGVKPIR